MSRLNLKWSHQYLHLVTGGLRGYMYSLRRFDASRLFYPSTAEVRSEWSKNGDWVLPFWGKAEHVPELGLWFAMARASLSRSGLYALDLDLDLPAAGAGGRPPPALCDVGFDLELRDDLFLFDHAVASLGSGRLCVARFYLIMKQEHMFDNPIGVFTGVEVVRGDDGRLRVLL